MLALLMRNQGLLGENPAGKNILPNTVLSLTKIDSYLVFCNKGNQLGKIGDYFAKLIRILDRPFPFSLAFFGSDL